MDIGKGVWISFKASLDKTYPQGLHIGDYTDITLGVVVLTHDFTNSRHLDTWIGSHCFIGARAIVCPGVRIGNGCIVAAGAVVTIDIPDGCIVSGNPARSCGERDQPGKYGQRTDIVPPARIDKPKKSAASDS